MFLVAIGAFTFGYLEVALLSHSSHSQAAKLRENYFRSVLRQDIPYFDTTKYGEIVSRIVMDTANIQRGVGEKLGEAIRFTTTFIVGFIVAFYYGWQLSLVLLAIVPVLAIAGFLIMKVVGDMSSSTNDSYAQAGAIVEEVFSQLRTVTSLNLEEHFCAKYNEKLDAAEKAGIKKG